MRFYIILPKGVISSKHNHCLIITALSLAVYRKLESFWNKKLHVILSTVIRSLFSYVVITSYSKFFIANYFLLSFFVSQIKLAYLQHRINFDLWQPKVYYPSVGQYPSQGNTGINEKQKLVCKKWKKMTKCQFCRFGRS